MSQMYVPHDDGQEVGVRNALQHGGAHGDAVVHNVLQDGGELHDVQGDGQLDGEELHGDEQDDWVLHVGDAKVPQQLHQGCRQIWTCGEEGDGVVDDEDLVWASHGGQPYD